jgi:hypothetical protein
VLLADDELQVMGAGEQMMSCFDCLVAERTLFGKGLILESSQPVDREPPVNKLENAKSTEGR